MNALKWIHRTLSLMKLSLHVARDMANFLQQISSAQTCQQSPITALMIAS
jgi:hypothetical protein